MLLELLPHFTRLLPVADKYFSSRSASDKAHEAALAGLAEEVRAGLGPIAEAQAGIGDQLHEQSAKLAEIAVDASRARTAVEGVEDRVAQLEKTAGTAVKLLTATLAAVVALLGTTLFLLVELLHRTAAH